MKKFLLVRYRYIGSLQDRHDFFKNLKIDPKLKNDVLKKLFLGKALLQAELKELAKEIKNSDYGKYLMIELRRKININVKTELVFCINYQTQIES